MVEIIILSPRQRVVLAAFDAIAVEAVEMTVLGVEAGQQRISAKELRDLFTTITPLMGKTSNEKLVYSYRKCQHSLEALDRIAASRRHP